MHAFLFAPLLAAPLIQIFVTICVIAILTALTLWALQQFGAPKPFSTIILVVGVVFAVLYVLNAFGLLSGIQ